MPLPNTRRSLIPLLLVGGALFLLNFWMAGLRQYSSNFDITEADALFGEDAMEVLVNGRQLADLGRISTFVWPGYMWHGTVKETLLYAPALVFGFHEEIPVLMAALVGAFIPWAVFLLLRRMFGRPTAVIGLLLSGALDVFVAQNVFMLGFPFDVQVALSLGFALFTLSWAERLRAGTQPGAVFCAAMGVFGGILLYAHPVALPVLLAAGVFLVLSGGRRLFTWRLAVAAAGAALGSARLWLYWIQHVPLSAFVSLESQRSGRFTWSQYLWGGKGFFAYLFSPSGNPFTRWAVGGVFVLTVAVAAWRLGRYVVAARGRVAAEGWRQGWPLPLYAYGVILFPCYMLFMQRLSGVARFGGPVHNYSVELWFWMTMAVAAWLGRLWAARRGLSLGLTCAATLFLYADLLLHFPKPTPRLLQLYAAYRADAATLIREHRQPLLYAQAMNGHMYPYLAPEPLVAADGLWNLGLLDPVDAVERHPCPPVLADLDAGVLGSNAWRTLPLATASVHDGFRMPPAGRWLSPTSWVWSVNEQPFQRGGAICDGNLATAWAQSRTGDVDRLVWTVRFDQPRTICRLVIVALCEKGLWWPSTYFRFKTHFARRIHPVEFMPADFSVEGLMADTGRWEVLVRKAGDPNFFWDGGRLFYDEKERCRLDMRLPPRRVTALRLVEERSGDRHWRKISELGLFEETPPAPPARDDEERLWERLRALAPARLYADRYISAQARSRMPGTDVWLPSVLRAPSYQEDHETDWPWFTAIEPLNPDRGVVVTDSAWAPAIDEALTREGVAFVRESLGAWTLYRFPPGQAVSAKRAGLVWTGTCVWTFPCRGTAQRWVSEARRLKDGGDVTGAAKALERALSDYPGYYEAARLLNAWSGREPADPAWRGNAPPARMLADPVRFSNGAELLAVEVAPDRVVPGGALELGFTWRLPPHWQGATIRPQLFCHLVKDRGIVVNADRGLLSGFSETDLLDAAPEGWVKDRFTVLLPRNAPAGEYSLEFGLIEASGKRVPVACRDPGVRIDRRSGVWMALFTVTP